MAQKAMRGLVFSVSGVVKTDDSDYIIMVDESSSFYFPVLSDPYNIHIINKCVDGVEFNIENYGIYFSLLSIFNAHEICPTQVSFIIKENGGTTCSIDITEQNELGIKISRVPLLLSDAAVMCFIGNIPIVVYGCSGTNFVFEIDKSVPKQNIFSYICDDISKSERIAAIGSNNQK